MYVRGREERLIHAASGHRVDDLETGSVLKKLKKEKRLQGWEKRTSQGQHFKQTKEVKSE